MSQPNPANTALSKKERHYAALAGQLEQLSRAFHQTHDSITIAAEQAHYIRKLGIGQAATFMATLDSVLQEGGGGAAEEHRDGDHDNHHQQQQQQK